MNSHFRGSALLVVLVALLLFAAISSIVLNRDVPPIGSEPSFPGVFEGDLRDLPTVAPFEEPPPFEGDIKDVKISTNEDVYKRGDSIQVTVKNDSAFPISHYVGPGCDIAFERKIDSNWERAEVYAVTSLLPCGLVKLESGQEWVTTVTILDDAVPGTYRAVFRFYEDWVNYSSEFQIN